MNALPSIVLMTRLLRVFAMTFVAFISLPSSIATAQTSANPSVHLQYLPAVFDLCTQVSTAKQYIEQQLDALWADRNQKDLLLMSIENTLLLAPPNDPRIIQRMEADVLMLRGILKVIDGQIDALQDQWVLIDDLGMFLGCGLQPVLPPVPVPDPISTNLPSGTGTNIPPNYSPPCCI